MSKTLPKTLPSEDEAGGAGEPDDDNLSKEEIFKVLSNQRRRWILQYLVDNGDHPVSLRHLVDRVTALENDVPVSQIDSTDRKNVYTALKQTHLPKMHDVGIIDYDPQRGQIEMKDAARDAEMHLEYVPERSIPWGKYYLGLSTIATSLVVFNIIGFYPFDILSFPTLIFLLMGVFGTTSIVHALTQQDNNDDLTVEQER